jgi:hypothetical protein
MPHVADCRSHWAGVPSTRGATSWEPAMRTPDWLKSLWSKTWGKVYVIGVCLSVLFHVGADILQTQVSPAQTIAVAALDVPLVMFWPVEVPWRLALALTPGYNPDNTETD